MAVEKVTMVNIVGKLKDINNFAKDVYLFNNLQLLNAMTEVEEGRYTLPIQENNIDELLGFSHLTQFPSKQPRQKEIDGLITTLKDYYGDRLSYDSKLVKDKELVLEDVIDSANSLIKKLEEKSNQLNFNLKILKDTQESIQAYSYLKDIDIPLRDLNDMNNFNYQIGSLTNDNNSRLQLIYPGIPCIMFDLGSSPKGEQVYLVITTNDFAFETNRVLKALDFKPVEGYNSAFQGTPEQILKMLQEKKNSLEREVEVLEAVRNGNLKKLQAEANLIYNELTMLVTIDTVKSYMAYSESHFYFSAWIPVRNVKEFENLINQYPDIIVLFQDPEAGLTPPTKLHNNWLFRPFEELVMMYGVPNYKEIDPTPFLSITYILFFGYMFGDVGQGALLLLGGLYAERKGFGLGGIAARIACSSIVFGFLYGSVFGIETIIPALWIRPMENTTTLLLSAVAIGVVCLIIAYIFSLINKRREHEIEQEYFGKNGVSGFLIYLLILSIVLMMYNYLPNSLIVREIIIIAIVILTILVFLALPMTNLVEHKKFSHDVDGGYYVSSFFEVFEMYLSMLSNTLSFIRVGAFALTHVGMFMAFQTIAEMIGSGVGGVIVLIIGNIFILGLEGLIDVIQCLRLEFYELFGKYYEGNGVEFVSVKQTVQKANQLS